MISSRFTKRGLAHEKLSRKKLKERFPSSRRRRTRRRCTSRTLGSCSRTWRWRAYELARSLGRNVREGSEVWRSRRMNDRVVVRLGNKERIVGRSCIVAPGAWLACQKWFNLHVPTTVTRDGVLLPKEVKLSTVIKECPFLFRI